MIKIGYCNILLLLWVGATLAKAKVSESDSLKTKSYEYLKQQINRSAEQSMSSKMYGLAWLDKARRENNHSEKAKAFKAILYATPKKQWMQYADSMVVSASHTNDNALKAASYMTKGIIFYTRRQHADALNNYLKADKLAALTKDEYLRFKIKYVIAQEKYYLGYYEEAISLFRECVDYYKFENDRAYLNALHNLGLSYNKVGKFDLTTRANKIGLEAGLDLEDLAMEPYFIHSEGINEFSRKNYKKAILLLKEALPRIIAAGDYANQAVAEYYIGNSFLHLSKPDSTMKYYLKVDRIINDNNYVQADICGIYGYLIRYFEKSGDQVRHLAFRKKFMKADSIFNTNYKYMSKKLSREFDNKFIREDNQKLRQTVRNNDIFFKTVFSALVTVLVLFSFLYYRNKKLLKNFQQKIAVKRASKTTSANTYISPDIAESIRNNLDKFEANKNYLEKEMNLVKLATYLNTNTKYVTLAIAQYRGKGSVEYVSELRVKYLMKLLESEREYRNYTNSALAEEVGFGSTQKFTTAFGEYAGTSPTNFINELNQKSP